MPIGPIAGPSQMPGATRWGVYSGTAAGSRDRIDWTRTSCVTTDHGGTRASARQRAVVLRRSERWCDHRGRPTGATAGFSDRVRDGDAWATDVHAVLTQAPVGAFGGTLPAGILRFQLSVCANGTNRGFKTRGGTTLGGEGVVGGEGVQRVALALGNVRVPKPPAVMRASMGGQCTRLDYTFAWCAAGVR